jgi:phosphopantothenoylcysteine decarboxylase/phosphopantothenate--cysteine ligase
MGIEMAKAFRNAGATVNLVLGGSLPAPWGIATERVRSAQEMLDACLALWSDMDGICGAAAVADQRPENYSPQKAKKRDGAESLVLARTPDILATLNESKTHQWMLGFAAESENIEHNAAEKLARKGLDAIFVNDISLGKAFGDQANRLTPITKGGAGDAIGPLPKDQLAWQAVRWFASHLEAT